MADEAILSQNDIYTAIPIIEVDGRTDDMVQSLLVEMDMTETDEGMSSLELNFINTATVEGRGNDLAFEYSDNDLFSIGKSVKVSAGDRGDPDEIFRGLGATAGVPNWRIIRAKSRCTSVGEMSRFFIGGSWRSQGRGKATVRWRASHS